MSPTKQNKKKIVAVSGGFDPLHVGHVRLFTEARALGDELLVILNNDNWLKDKKGQPFMSEDERKEVLEALESVDRVVLTEHEPGEYFEDKSVVKMLEKEKPDVFANGGDRRPDGDPIPEEVFCKKEGIKLVYRVGHGGKIQSSSWLIKNAEKK